MQKKFGKIIVIILIIGLAGTLACLGIQAITHTGLFKIPGKVIFSNLTEEQSDFLNNILYTDDKLNLELDKDVTIAASEASQRPSGENDLLYEIYLPTTDFYSTETNIILTGAVDPENGESSSPCSGTCSLTPFAELDNSKKLLAINDDYFLDNPDAGAFFAYFTLSAENPEDLAAVKNLIQPRLQTFPESADEFLTFAQTGVTALSRAMNSKLTAVGGDGKYFSANIGEFLSGFDLTHTSNESSFIAGASSRQICSLPGFKETLLDIGLNIVELTGNHNQDCGDAAARDTIDFYNTNNIKVVGGGKTASEAAEPLLINEKNTGITMLAYNLSTGGYTLDNTPGANFYDEEDAKINIAAAKDRGDTIIIDIQFYECSEYDKSTWTSYCVAADSTASDPTYGSESQFFRHLIDLGADIVVGTAAHQTQTYELYGDGVIYYGLGNLFFDQIWWPDTTRSLILGHYFYNGKLLQTRLYGTIYGDDYRTRLMDAEEEKWFISQLVAAH